MKLKISRLMLQSPNNVHISRSKPCVAMQYHHSHFVERGLWKCNTGQKYCSMVAYMFQERESENRRQPLVSRPSTIIDNASIAIVRLPSIAISFVCTSNIYSETNTKHIYTKFSKNLKITLKRHFNSCYSKWPSFACTHRCKHSGQSSIDAQIVGSGISRCFHNHSLQWVEILVPPDTRTFFQHWPQFIVHRTEVWLEEDPSFALMKSKMCFCHHFCIFFLLYE